MNKNPTLYIVDASSYIFRAYFAIRHLSTSKGFPTNATYGFTQMLLKLLKDEKPEYLVLVFDSKEPSFRKQEYEAYKANREVPPDDLLPQFASIKQVVDALNIPRLEIPGFEADDIIATIAKKLVPKESPVVIVTGDKDLMQLVNHHIVLLDTMKDKRIDETGVKEKFGVRPEQVVDVLGLMGDSSDNIPGVPGIGPKTAGQLIQTFGSMEQLYERLGEVSGKKAGDLKTHRDQAFLSKRLATLRLDAPVEFSYASFVKQEPKLEECKAVFAELEFHNLLKEFGGFTPSLPTGKYRLIDSAAAFQEWMKSFRVPFAFDTETTSLDSLKARLVGLSFAFGAGEACYLPLGHSGEEGQLESQSVLQHLKPWLENPQVPKYAQHFKYDAQVLRNYGVEVRGLACDTMLASYLLDPAASHKLDNLAARYLEHKMISFEEVAGKTGDFSKVPLQQAAAYSCEDADVTWRLAELFQTQLAEQGLEALFRDVEIPLCFVLAAMERRGIKLDREFLLQLQVDFGRRIQERESEIHRLAGDSFNIQSPKQLAVILFEKLGLPAQRKTKTGYSTDVDVLTELAKLHELPKEILEYRSLVKLKSTYVDALLNILDPVTHRVHTSFNQTVAETGRLSSSDPNLQNIPIRSEDGAKIRRAFVAETGHVLLSADYSQIELRILAHLSEDPALGQAFAEGLDVHRRTAAGIFNIHESLVTPAMRSAGKTVNFAVVYGQTPFGLAQQLGVTQSQAKKYIDQYFEKYAGVRDYRERVLAEARKKKEVRTLLGRRRFVPDIVSGNALSRNLAERIAFNTVIQGTAADVIKKAMVEIFSEITARKLKSGMLLQVHDELVFEAENSEVQDLRTLVKMKMERSLDLRVPLQVEIGTGANWAEAH